MELTDTSEAVEPPPPIISEKLPPEKVEILTVKECTKVIRELSEHTVHQLVAQNKVRYMRTGQGKRGKILINKADLIKYFE